MPGIGEWWDAPETPVSDFLLRIGETGMCLLPAGNVAHPASVLQSPRIAELFAGLAKQFDWVIIDTPPLLPMADSNLWSRLSDGTLLVVRKGAVSRAALKKAVESLDNPKLVGIVLNDASDYDRVNYYDQYYTERNAERCTGRGSEEVNRRSHAYVPVRSMILGLSEAVLATLGAAGGDDRLPGAAERHAGAGL